MDEGAWSPCFKLCGSSTCLLPSFPSCPFAALNPSGQKKASDHRSDPMGEYLGGTSEGGTRGVLLLRHHAPPGEVNGMVRSRIPPERPPTMSNSRSASPRSEGISIRPVYNPCQRPFVSWLLSSHRVTHRARAGRAPTYCRRGLGPCPHGRPRTSRPAFDGPTIHRLWPC